MEKCWYYMAKDRNKYGPYTDLELITLMKQEVLTGDDYIWMIGMEKWLQLKDSIYSIYLPHKHEKQQPTD